MTRSPNLALGILLVICAGFFVSGMDAFAKHLMGEVNFLQVVWARYSFHALAVGTWLLANKRRDFLRARRPGLQFIRASCVLVVTLTMYTALQTVPLSDATAVMFFAPVLVSALAGVFLGEAVGWRRMCAVAVGFIGVLIIVNPTSAIFKPEILWACVAAIGLAIYFLLTRRLQALDNEDSTLFYTTAVGAVVLSFVVPFFWSETPLSVWAQFVIMGLLGALGHFLLIRAFHLAPASVLSPFLNSQLVASIIYSLVIFGDSLKVNFIIGTFLVVGAGLFTWYRERKLHKSLK